MQTYSEVEPAEWANALDLLRDDVGKSPTLEAAGAIVTRALYERFSETTALARLYAVIPYRSLDSEVAAFVDGLAAKAKETARVRPETPVLTLLGTHGAKGEWCDRRKSVAHRGIPLVSASFVQSIPMVARLLKELEVDLSFLDRIDAAPELNARRLVGGFNGVFYVDDAASARDVQGRLIIPAQDFVVEQGIKTVFGMGGYYPNGTLLAIIVFARERLKRSQVERLSSLISSFKGETFGAVRARRFFDVTPEMPAKI